MIRASVIAHMLRTGHKPVVGMVLNFSAQLKEVEAEDKNSIDLAALKSGVPVGDKAWCTMTITQEDIDAGIKLINDQEMTYKTEGKLSQFPYKT